MAFIVVAAPSNFSGSNTPPQSGRVLHDGCNDIAMVKSFVFSLGGQGVISISALAFTILVLLFFWSTLREYDYISGAEWAKAWAAVYVLFYLLVSTAIALWIGANC